MPHFTPPWSGVGFPNVLIFRPLIINPSQEETFLEWLFYSPFGIDLALFCNRVLLGLFFVLARFRWFYSPDHPEAPWFNTIRHESLAHKMAYCGLRKYRYCWACLVAAIEVLCGLGMIAGLLSFWCALGLLCILIRAAFCTAKEKTMRQNPVDRVDVVSCYLWTPEPVYTGLAIIALVAGPGAWSMDALVQSWLS